MGNEIYPLVKDFADFLKTKLDEALENGKVETRIIGKEVFKWEIKNFDYSVEKGIISHEASGIQNSIEIPVFIHEVDEQIKLTDEYKKLIEELSKRSVIQNLENKMMIFIRKINSVYLREKEIPEQMLSIFIKELKGEPIKMWVDVELFGLTLEPDEINITSEITLKKPTKKYLEREKTISLFNQDNISLEYPSAILRIDILGKSPIDLQKQIERTITILRLFGSGGVKYIKYESFSEGVITFCGAVSRPFDTRKSNQSYPIYNKDVARLKKFFGEISDILPLRFESYKNLDDNLNLGFSYQRYTEAILQNELTEKRIVNTISGLESLYSNSTQELSRHLRISIGNFMGLFGYDAYEVRKKIKDSYDIRSKFIHGNHLDYNSKKVFIEKHGSLENLFSYVVDYLRISIVLFLALGMGKDQFIDLLEDILIDDKKKENFKIQIENIKEKFGLN